jgi:hypothetical protein
MLTQNPRVDAIIVSEAEGGRSRGVISYSGVDPMGTVIGKVTATGAYAFLNPSSDDGSEVAAAVILRANPGDGGPFDGKAEVFLRDAEIDGNYFGGVQGNSNQFASYDDTQKAAVRTQLAALGIVVR